VAWLVEHAALLPTAGDALDVACGRGRHALWIASRGLRVRAVDRDADAIAELQDEARRRGVALVADVLDLEAGTTSFGRDAYDLIVVVHYLHRPLFPALRDALRPGGVLVYETFTEAQARRGRPTNPAFLLAPGELERLVAPLEILESREGEFDGRDVASVIARRPST
jgi:SAM-dependent methyltransferase